MGADDFDDRRLSALRCSCGSSSTAATYSGFPKVSRALQAAKPLLAAINATPRAIKRYQNRMRYLAARLRPAIYEPDRIDSMLHWLGVRLRYPLVPAIWFNEQPRQAIDEPALILLGALELFVPKAFVNPAELFTKLEHGTPGDKPSEEEIQAWSKVRDAFATQGLAMPTAAEIARYATFVSNKERTAPPILRRSSPSLVN